jgi:hypothetical protein
MLITRVQPNPWRRATAATSIGVACLCLGLLASHPSAAPTPPDVASVQAAYDEEKASGSPLHVDDLLIRDSDCNPIAGRGYGCQVSYVRKANANGRLYFDVIVLEPGNGGWKLVSGLCRGKKAEISL